MSLTQWDPGFPIPAVQMPEMRGWANTMGPQSLHSENQSETGLYGEECKLQNFMKNRSYHDKFWHMPIFSVTYSSGYPDIHHFFTSATGHLDIVVSLCRQWGDGASIDIHPVKQME